MTARHLRRHLLHRLLLLLCQVVGRCLLLVLTHYLRVGLLCRSRHLLTLNRTFLKIDSLSTKFDVYRRFVIKSMARQRR